ncbi:MAG: mandelate racemase/muconate lactonizing enzyme family protein [Anaerolineae bacterium]|nr:mandelate racemase/muconate lactonizing enzyme family protein [Anaerolineae bacterium]
MQITELKTTAVAVPGTLGYVPAVIVQLLTDEGLVGLGEAPSPIGTPASQTIIDSAAPLLVGQDPLQPEILKKRLYAAFNLTHLHIHAACWALNAIDMALWDLVGKACGQPLYRIWGGAFRKRIPFYGSVSHELSPEEAGAKAAEYVAQGFGTIYRKVGLDEASDLACLQAIREAIGPEIRLRVDANQSWSAGEALRIIGRMAAYDLEFVDQPVLMYNIDELARVRAASPVPIAAHEASWTMYEAVNVIKRGAADVIHVDPRFDAGMMGARITAGMAEAAGLPVVMHHFSTLGVALCAYLHVIAACPNFTYANQTGYFRLHDDVLAGGLIPFERGCIPLPEGPGIGAGLDADKLAAYAAAYDEHVRGKEFSQPAERQEYLMMQYRRFFGV